MKLLKKCKVVFKIKKDHLRKIAFLMAIQDICFKQFASMQGLENSNWIISDP